MTLKRVLLPSIFIILMCPPQPATGSDAGICNQYISIDRPDNSKSRDEIPYGRGLLWKVEANNGNFIHLFGTMHSQDKLVTSIHPKVRLNLVKSRLFVMEVLLDEEANRYFSEAIFYESDENLKQLLDPVIYAKLENIVNDYGISKVMLPRLKPWAAFTLVGRPKPVQAPTQDLALMQLALSANINIESLETMNDLVQVLDSIPVRDQVTILNDTVCNHKQILRDARVLIDLYIQRDLAGIILFNQKPQYDEGVYDRFINLVLYERNRRMVEKIEQYISMGNVFIAVGASHLPDKSGILDLLSEKGYVVTPVF